ncbi:uncharacterized protein LOC118431170 isoform X2 [Branchiostoma floridae]|uniref:Uncharacterized protein LOC118431170 isoform X2 n=1 Tax=Branchiostoma floridae TaxID=7739 RepID=A0A9J7MBG6_BRAFL|nr:uncharacterized protein LOC118431170 isoform X2 [Branchiostoma floridae]
MSILKIISERKLDERILSGLQKQSLTCLEQNTPTEKTNYGNYKQYKFSSNTLEVSGTIIFTLESCSDKERASLVEAFCTDDTPYVSLPISMLEEEDNKSHNTVYRNVDFYFKVNEIINARNATTVKETMRIVQEVVEAENVDIKPFQVSSRNDEERLREELLTHRPCKVMCCVDNSARNIIFSPTEPDEASHIVDAAKDVCGKNGIFLLLRGHRGVRDDELYDTRQFNTTFLGRQPKLQELVEADQFVSTYSDLNGKQKRAVLVWVCRQPDNPSPSVKPRSDSINQCEPAEGECAENVPQDENSSFFSRLESINCLLS